MKRKWKWIGNLKYTETYQCQENEDCHDIDWKEFLFSRILDKETISKGTSWEDLDETNEIFMRNVFKDVAGEEEIYYGAKWMQKKEAERAVVSREGRKFIQA